MGREVPGYCLVCVDEVVCLCFRTSTEEVQTLTDW